MIRRAVLKTLSMTPLLAAAPAGAMAAPFDNDFFGEFSNQHSSAFVFDARRPFARALGKAALNAGRKAYVIETEDSGFWRAKDGFDLGQPMRALSGATSRRTFYVFEQLSRQHWGRKLTDAVILHDDRDTVCWTLHFQNAH